MGIDAMNKKNLGQQGASAQSNVHQQQLINIQQQQMSQYVQNQLAATQNQYNSIHINNLAAQQISAQYYPYPNLWCECKYTQEEVTLYGVGSSLVYNNKNMGYIKDVNDLYIVCEAFGVIHVNAEFDIPLIDKLKTKRLWKLVTNEY